LLAAAGQQQQSWRAYQSGYDQARNKNKKGIVDGSMYLVRLCRLAYMMAAAGSAVTTHVSTLGVHLLACLLPATHQAHTCRQYGVRTVRCPALRCQWAQQSQ
jgi:hypothetical protein